MPVKHRTKADFLARVEDLFKADPLAETSRDVIAVLELLSKKISPAKSPTCATPSRRKYEPCGRNRMSRQEQCVDDLPSLKVQPVAYFAQRIARPRLPSEDSVRDPTI